jgi:hypothetical protein
MKKCNGKSNIDIVKDYLAGVRPFTELSMHIPEKDKFHKEGEKWKDSNGIEWQKKDGKTIRLTKTKGDIIREAIGDELNCKLCKANWKFASKNDRKFLTRTGLCEECLINYETKLRILGIYESYEKYRLASYELGHLKELKLRIAEVIETLKRTGGNVINLAENEFDNQIVWENTNKDKNIADAEKDLKDTIDLIKRGEGITKGFKKEYLKNIKKYKLTDIISK